VISAREQQLEDLLEMAMNVIDGLSAELWKARIATVAVMSLRIGNAYGVTSFDGSSGGSTLPTTAPLPPGSDSAERPSDARIFEALAHGPRRGSAIGRDVYQTNRLTPSQRGVIWRALHELTLQGALVCENRFYRLPFRVAQEEIAS
jgi:hypothetical protein